MSDTETCPRSCGLCGSVWATTELRRGVETVRGCRVCATHKQRQQRKRIEPDEPTQYSHNCTWPRAASSKRRCVCACHHHVLVSSLTACIPCLLRRACACCVPLLVRPVSPGPAGGGCHTPTTYNITRTLHRCVRACCVRVYVASNLFENTPLALFNRESAPQQRGGWRAMSATYV